jgi:hypothetical protein
MEIQMNDVELEIGLVDNRVVLYIQHTNSDMEPVLITFKDAELTSFIEGLKEAQQKTLEN